MDMVRSEVRKLAAEDYSTAQHLEHATEQARERNYQDFLIVDVDSHHYESESYKDVFEYIESPVIRREALESAKRGGRASACSAARSATRTSAGASRATSCAGTTSAGTTSSALPITATSA